VQTERESSVVSRSRDGEQDRTANRYRTKSVNVNSKQPPNQKKANHCHQNMADPLARCLRIAKVKHAAIVASSVEKRDTAI
jgi:hypothetical protein